LRARPCDVVHIMNLSQFVPIVRLLNQKSKVVLHMQCDWLTRLNRASLASRLRRVDLILTCSDYLTSRAISALPQFTDRCRTVYNGVDVERFAPNGPRRSGGGTAARVLWVGRISP